MITLFQTMERENLPVEIANSDGKVMEVRFTCDECGSLIGAQLIRKAQAEAYRNIAVICQNCRQTKEAYPKKKESNKTV